MDWRLRISMCLALAHDLQGRVRKNKLYEADELFRRYRRADREACFQKKLEKCRAEGRFAVMKALFGLLEEMEVLKKDLSLIHI